MIFIMKKVPKYILSKKKDYFSIFVYFVIIYLTIVLLNKLPITRREEQDSEIYMNTMSVKVESVENITEEEVDVKNNEIDVMYDQIGFYVPDTREYKEITISHLSGDYRIRKGMRIVVYTFDGSDFHYKDVDRMHYMKYLVVIFIISVGLIGGILGLKALMSLIFSFVVLIYGLIPVLEKGYDPVLSIVVVGFFILASSLLFIYGFKKKSLIAFIGTSCGLFLAYLLSLIFANILNLTGVHDEVDSFLMSNSTCDYDMKSLLIGSFILGTLGVIDDVTVSQVVTVEELLRHSPNSSIKKLFTSAMRIGRSHIASMINTLFLAYFSVSLSLVLVIVMQDWRIIDVANRPFFAAEIVRTLVGSIGLLISVPITTLLACVILKGGVKNIFTILKKKFT